MVAHQAPLIRGFSRQECWSGLPFPSPGDLPTQGSNPSLLRCRQILYHVSPLGPVSCSHTDLPGLPVPSGLVSALSSSAPGVSWRRHRAPLGTMVGPGLSNAKYLTTIVSYRLYYFLVFLGGRVNLVPVTPFGLKAEAELVKELRKEIQNTFRIVSCC